MAVTKNNPEGNRYFDINGQKVTIPQKNGDAFLAKYPDAVEFGVFDIGGKDPAIIPIHNVGKFLEKYPDVKPYYASDTPYIADNVMKQAKGTFDQMWEAGKQGAQISWDDQKKKKQQVDWGSTPQAASYTGALPDPAKMPQRIGTLSEFGQAFKSAGKDVGAALLQAGEKVLMGATVNPATVAVSMFDNAVSKVVDDDSTPLATRQALNDYLLKPKTFLGEAAQTLHASAAKDMPKEESFATMMGSILPNMGLVIGTIFVPELAPATLGVMGSIGGGSQSLGYVDWIRERNKTNDPVTYNPMVDAGGMLLGAGFEIGFEHFGSFARYGINKALSKSAANTLFGKLFSTKAGEKIAEDVFLDFIQKQPELGEKVLRITKHIIEEGGEEGGTELSNIATEALTYKDDITLNQIISRTAKSVAAGGLMGAMISPVGTWAQNKSYDNIREQNGFVALASTKDGRVFEVFGQQGSKLNGVDNRGERVDIEENDVDEYVKMSLKQFSEFKNTSLKAQDAVLESQPATEAEPTPEQTVESSIRSKVAETVNKDSGMVETVALKGREEPYNIISTNPENPENVIVRNTLTGEVENISLNDIVPERHEPVDPETIIAEQIQKALAPKAPAFVTANGKKYAVIEDNGEEGLIVQDETGQQSSVSPANYPLLDEFDPATGAFRPHEAAPQDINQQVTSQPTEKVEQLQYPVDKNGQPDIEKMDEVQLFNYNKENFGEETAISDLQGDIKLIDEKIIKAEKKLATSDTKAKIKARLEIAGLKEKKAKLEGLMPQVANSANETQPNAEVATVESAPESEQVSVQETNQPVSESTPVETPTVSSESSEIPLIRREESVPDNVLNETAIESKDESINTVATIFGEVPERTSKNGGVVNTQYIVKISPDGDVKTTEAKSQLIRDGETIGSSTQANKLSVEDFENQIEPLIEKNPKLSYGAYNTWESWNDGDRENVEYVTFDKLTEGVGNNRENRKWLTVNVYYKDGTIGKYSFELNNKSVPSQPQSEPIQNDTREGVKESKIPTWHKAFEELKAKNDLAGLDNFYGKVKIALNGVAQSKGEEVVKEFEELKAEIEQYAKDLKQELPVEQPKASDSLPQQEEATATETPAPVEPRTANEVTGGGEKQPWEMTKKEYLETIKNSTTKSYETHSGHALNLKQALKMNLSAGETNHQFYIKKALDEGKPVPQDVLNDYPQLKTISNETETQTPQREAKALLDKPSVELKAKKPWPTPKVVTEARKIVPLNPYEEALRYFIDGGKIGKNGLISYYGGTVGKKAKNINGEIASRFTYRAKGETGPGINDIAHSLWQSSELANTDGPIYSTQDYREAVESVINDFVHPAQMAKALIKRREIGTENLSAEDEKRLLAEQEYQRQQEAIADEHDKAEILEQLINTYGEYPHELFNFVEDENNGTETGTLQEESGISDQGDNGENRTKPVGSVTGDETPAERGSEVKSNAAKVAAKQLTTSIQSLQEQLQQGKISKKEYDVLAEQLRHPKTEKTPAQNIKEKFSGEIPTIQTSASKYGWTASAQPDGSTQLINRKGVHVANVTQKGSKYTITDTTGAKLLTGNANVPLGVEKVIKDYFYGKEVSDSPLFSKAIPQTKQSEIGFYSTVEKALNAIQQDKGTPEQFKAMLLKNGAKQAEMDWMDFDGNFSGKKSVTKQDVQDWVDGNKIDVKEVQQGGEKPQESQRKKLIEERHTLLNSIEKKYDYKVYGDEVLYAAEVGEKHPGITDEEYAELKSINDKIEAFDKLPYPKDTKFHAYQLPGGENYKEILLTMPVKKVDANYEKIDGIWIATINGKELGRSNNISELREKLGDTNYPTGFTSSHFDEKNIIAHVRINDRTDTQGRKVLFVEEFQSDFSQSLKKKTDKYRDLLANNPDELIDMFKKSGKLEVLC